jgi:hypothetical protein
MSFVNEYIPEADRKKYNITEENHFYRAGSSDWTVDRERGMFLITRWRPGPENPRGETGWAFYWRGHLLDVLLRNLESRDDDSHTHLWQHKKIAHIGQMTPELGEKRSQIVEDLRDALTVNGGWGVGSPFKSYELRLDTE